MARTKPSGDGYVTDALDSDREDKKITIAKGDTKATGPQGMKVSVRLTAAVVSALKRYPPSKIKSVVSFTANGCHKS